MRAVVRGFGALILFLLVALSFAPTVIPPFLDRIYYQGPPGPHFDGERFFNPDIAAPSRRRGNMFSRWAGSTERATWPSRIAVTPGRPPSRVEGDEMQVTWIGHATVLVQTQGLNILTDPIWSKRASPFSFIGPSRVRAPGVRFEDLPKIDLVVVSHNHYDHLDLPTLKRLWLRDRPQIVVSLGNDTILRNHGIVSTALDWGGRLMLRPGIEVIVERNHHWSSRWFTDRNRALWSAFTIRTRGGNIFFAGDTGWGDGSWVTEAARRGPFRLAIIPIGAYEPRDFMRHHHIDPAEAVRIYEALVPARALGVHWGTFQLTFEPIDDPRQQLARLRVERGISPDAFIATEVGQTFAVPALKR
jgi:L-ascorbate metabolism protein UlaG (beta-lactamase superfamily)